MTKLVASSPASRPVDMEIERLSEELEGTRAEHWRRPLEDELFAVMRGKRQTRNDAHSDQGRRQENQMTSSVTEMLDWRQRLAAREARRTAINLTEGHVADLKAQIEAEDALDDLHRYTMWRKDLATVAADLAAYGRNDNRHDLLQEMWRAHAWY